MTRESHEPKVTRRFLRASPFISTAETAPPDDPLLQDLPPAALPGLSPWQVDHARRLRRGRVLREYLDLGAAMADALRRRERPSLYPDLGPR